VSQPTASNCLLLTSFRVVDRAANQRSLTLFARAEASSVRCPICGSRSEQIYSHYIRTVSDLPWRGIAVGLKVKARKFFLRPRTIREACGDCRASQETAEKYNSGKLIFRLLDEADYYRHKFCALSS
jgi:transposase